MTTPLRKQGSGFHLTNEAGGESTIANWGATGSGPVLVDFHLATGNQREGGATLWISQLPTEKKRRGCPLTPVSNWQVEMTSPSPVSHLSIGDS